jgi:stage V sporulation protein AE
VEYLRAFLVGGTICIIGQILMDTTKWTTGHILVAFVISGVFLTALGIYEPIIEFGGAGASIPLTGFGYNLARGVMKEVHDVGMIGIFSGGVKSAATGITAVVVFGYSMAILFNPKMKK